jgi:hypothetical protein
VYITGIYNIPPTTATDFTAPALKEAEAYPALAEDGYGWEKLFSERMCRHYMEDFGLVRAGGAVPQCVWPMGNLVRWKGKGAGSHLPQGDRSQANRQA